MSISQNYKLLSFVYIKKYKSHEPIDTMFTFTTIINRHNSYIIHELKLIKKAKCLIKLSWRSTKSLILYIQQNQHCNLRVFGI